MISMPHRVLLAAHWGLSILERGFLKVALILLKLDTEGALLTLVFALVGEFLLKKFQNMNINYYFDSNVSLLCSFCVLCI